MLLLSKTDVCFNESSPLPRIIVCKIVEFQPLSWIIIGNSGPRATQAESCWPTQLSLSCAGPAQLRLSIAEYGWPSNTRLSIAWVLLAQQYSGWVLLSIAGQQYSAEYCWIQQYSGWVLLSMVEWSQTARSTELHVILAERGWNPVILPMIIAGRGANPWKPYYFYIKKNQWCLICMFTPPM